ncbi:MAG: hypothetical protein WBD58_19570 [Geitlerinemataceae cyanobacterium]
MPQFFEMAAVARSSLEPFNNILFGRSFLHFSLKAWGLWGVKEMQRSPFYFSLNCDNSKDFSILPVYD